MTTESTDARPTIVPSPSGSAEGGGHSYQPLRKGAVGLVAVVFMAVANAAPITAMTGNVPIAVGYGNGLGAPAGFLIATIVLTIFSVGFVSMAKHITATGSFYGFISHGLGRVAGLASGLLATMAYVVFEASLIGIFSSFAKTTVSDLGGPDVSWIVYALVCIAIIAACGYFDISLSGKVLGVFLVLEVVILALMGLSVLFSGGGPDGLIPGDTINPGKAFSSVSVDGATGSAAIGLFFAFWSWVGFETTAVYGEESKDPKRIVPRATLIAVIALGLFYIWISWMAISAAGKSGAIDLSAGSSPFDLFYNPVDDKLGGSALDLYKILTVTGSFACALAFHNAASRYLYALGREGLVPGLDRTLGAAHAKHGSPHISSVVQSVVTLLITLAFFWLQSPTKAAPDVPYTFQYGLLAVLGTFAILIIQTVCSVAVISYFHIGKHHPETAHWWKTFLAPLLGAIGMAYVCWLLIDNFSFAAGAASGSPLYTAIPWIVGITALVGVVGALYLRSAQPERYARIGRVMIEDSHERTVEL